jgi:hypothetical protein
MESGVVHGVDAVDVQLAAAINLGWTVSMTGKK